MGARKRGEPIRDRGEDEARDQEVLRATRELTAYFRGRRTEREARAALKIIKAFIRDREQTPAPHRRPLPAVRPETRLNEPVPIRSHTSGGSASS